MVQQAAFANVLDRLESPRVTGDHAMAACPSHEDRQPSLSVRYSRDRVVLYCHGGCATEQVIESLGLGWEDLFDCEREQRAPRDELLATYTYCDPKRQPYLMVERWRSAQGARTFRQRRPDGQYRLDGLKPILYRLPEVLAAAQAGGTVYLTEGEKDADTLARRGLVATTGPGGAGKWRPYYTEWLRGAKVVLIADDDPAGRKHAAQVADALRMGGVQVRVVRPRAGKDATEHLIAHGFGIEELVDFDPAQRRPIGMSHQRLMGGVPVPKRWPIPGLLSEGLAMLGGAPKRGKSWTALDMGLGVASGTTAMGSLQCAQGAVLYLSLDNDGEQRLRDRMSYFPTLPADLPIEWHTEGWPTGDQAVAAVREWAKSTPGASMAVIDTLVRVEPDFDEGPGGGYRASTGVLGRWSRLAHAEHIAILFVHHDRKATPGPGEDWVNRFTGSRGITASVDTLMLLDGHRDSREGTLRFSSRDLDMDDLQLYKFGPRWHVETPMQPPALRVVG